MPRPPPPAAALISERVADLVAEREHLLGRLGRVGHARDDRHAGRLHRLARPCLLAHQLDRLRRRADPRQPGLLDRAGEAGVLGQEAVAGVHGLRAGACGRLEQPLDDAGSSRPRGPGRYGRPRRPSSRAARRGRRRSRRRPTRSRARGGCGRCGSRSRRGWRPGSSRTRLQGNVPVLALGPGLALPLRRAQRVDQHGTRAARLDHVVDVAALGRGVRVRKPLPVVRDQLGTPVRRRSPPAPTGR